MMSGAERATQPIAAGGTADPKSESPGAVPVESSGGCRPKPGRVHRR